MSENEYFIHRMVEQRLTEARAAAAHYELVALMRAPRRSLRVALGEALIAAGRRLAGTTSLALPRTASRAPRWSRAA